MKLNTYAFLAAALACGMANAETAYTTPVGYVTLTTPANSDSTITPGLDQATVFAAASTGISGNEISASGLTAGSFVTPKCYVQVTSGPLSGKRFPVVSTSATAITVDPVVADSLATQGFVSGNTFKVVPYWTLATLFPNGQGVGGTDDVFNVSSFLFVVDNGSYGANKAASASYFYCTGDTGNGVTAGWYDANDPFGASADSLPLDPTIMYFIRNGAGTDQVTTITGTVPDIASGALVPVSTVENDVNIGISFPVDTTLQASGLQSVIQGTSDVFSITEFVYVYDDTAIGQNKAPSASYFYCTGDTGNGVVEGWYDANDPFGAQITGSVLKASRCIVVRKAPVGADDVLDLTIPLPYTL